MENIIDYTNHIPSNCLLAQGKGTNFLMLSELEEPIKRFDGKKGYFEVSYFWLSESCQSPDDEAWCCVQGNDYIYLTKKEAKEALRDIKKGDCNLFEHFNLF